MKSIIALLPLAGLALAQEGCTRRTVTKTETEKVYVTGQPSEAPITSTIDITTTSTIDITTTVTIRPTFKPSASGLHWSGYYNGTHSYPTGGPSPILSTGMLTSTPEAASETVKPAYTPGQGYNTIVIPTSEVSPAPAASAQAAPVANAQAMPVANAQAAPVSRAAKTGKATFYGGAVAGGMCSFTGYTIPSNLFGTALSGANWEGGASCGVCVSVTGPNGNKITAMVVDQCPECEANHLDLFETGFAKLADKSKGIIPISWDTVPCGITSPIVLKNKSGTSPYWFSMQVMNANVAIAKLEVSIDGGRTWKATTRKPYNFFENPAGFGTQTLDVKVTSASGQSIIIKGVDVKPESLKTGGSNFS